MSNSKKVFLTLAIITGTLAFTTMLLILVRVLLDGQADVPIRAWILLVPFAILLFAVLIAVLIGRFVYYDALKRGMDPWLWVTVAVFIPNLIGLVIYLIVRSQYAARPHACTNCNRPLDPHFNVCPYCGAAARAKCAHCGMALETDWTHCPNCGKHL